MKTILISREDLEKESVRIIYPLHMTEPHIGARDFISMTFSWGRTRSNMVDVNLDNWGIGEQDGEVWTIDEIVKAKTK